MNTTGVGMPHWLAPNHIPLEILCQIFEFVSKDHTCTLPPKVLEPPWVLGQVCREWREISRSMRNLWKIDHIIVKARRPSTILPNIELDQQGIRVLTMATDILPHGSRISLDVVQRTFEEKSLSLKFDPIHPSAVLQFLPLVKDLIWKVDFDPTLFPPGSLEGIEQLSIMPPDYDGNPQPAIAPFSGDQFGLSPRLQELRADSLTPYFLFSGIPLSCLRSLTLHAWSPHMRVTSEVESAWWTFSSNSSIGFPNLEKLSLFSPFKLLEIILRGNFTWHQLTSFTIGSADSLFENLPLLFNTLHLSTRLVNLQIQLWGSFHESEQLWENDPIKLPFLQNLKVDWHSRQFPMIKHLISASVLRSLDAGELSLSNFYFVVRQCPRLVELISAIKTRIPDPVPSEPSYIVLPCLKHLDLSFNDEWSPSSFPTLLTLPGLDSLNIFIFGPGSFPLDLLFDLINRSNARLCRIHGRVIRYTSLEPAESVFLLLTALEGASHVDLGNVTFPQTVLDLIAAGSLLPHLESLMFGASTLEQGLAMIESRLRYEESCGAVKLKRSKGLIAHRSPTANRANGVYHIDFVGRELTTRYGVKCDFDYVDPLDRH